MKAESCRLRKAYGVPWREERIGEEEGDLSVRVGARVWVREGERRGEGGREEFLTQRREGWAKIAKGRREERAEGGKLKAEGGREERRGGMRDES